MSVINSERAERCNFHGLETSHTSGRSLGVNNNMVTESGAVGLHFWKGARQMPDNVCIDSSCLGIAHRPSILQAE